jgi:rhodanese-related sulfurtransferase
MFDVHCDGHGSTTLLSTRSIVGLEQRDGVITLRLRCWCGHVIEHLTGRAAAPDEPRSIVTAVPPARPRVAEAHFSARLAYETDPTDVWHDLTAGTARFVLLDARSREAFEEAHLPGAVSGPYRELTESWARKVLADHDADLFVAYCWGPACNAATKAGARLAAFGVPVKEMIGGIEGWRNEGFPVETGPDHGRPDPDAEPELLAS